MLLFLDLWFWQRSLGLTHMAWFTVLAVGACDQKAHLLHVYNRIAALSVAAAYSENIFLLKAAISNIFIYYNGSHDYLYVKGAICSDEQTGDYHLTLENLNVLQLTVLQPPTLLFWLTRTTFINIVLAAADSCFSGGKVLKTTLSTTCPSPSSEQNSLCIFRSYAAESGAS